MAALLALVTLACFEQPITEKVAIRLLPGGGAVVTVTVAITEHESSDNPLLRERIEQARSMILEGRDTWSRRFEQMAPSAERLTWEKDEGSISRVIHSGYVVKGDDLRQFFSDSLVELPPLPETPGGSCPSVHRRNKLHVSLDNLLLRNI